jgi:hypothetical protein
MNLTPLELETLVQFLAMTRNAFTVLCGEMGADADEIAGKLTREHVEKAREAR